MLDGGCVWLVLAGVTAAHAAVACAGFTSTGWADARARAACNIASSLARDVEAVAALDLDHRHASAQKGARARERGRHELVDGRVAHVTHGGADAAACRHDLCLALAPRPARELVGAIAREQEVRVTVDEAGDDTAPAGVDRVHA